MEPEESASPGNARRRAAALRIRQYRRQEVPAGYVPGRPELYRLAIAFLTRTQELAVTMRGQPMLVARLRRSAVGVVVQVARAVMASGNAKRRARLRHARQRALECAALLDALDASDPHARGRSSAASTRRTSMVRPTLERILGRLGVAPGEVGKATDHQWSSPE